jgi:hypothetical protein
MFPERNALVMGREATLFAAVGDVGTYARLHIRRTAGVCLRGAPYAAGRVQCEQLANDMTKAVGVALGRRLAELDGR